MRLERIREEYDERVTLVWRAFLLRPQPRATDLERFRRYTRSWERAASQADGGRFRVWSTNASPPTHSVPPAVAVKAAARQEAFGRFHLALMDAYFWDNRDVTSQPVLVDVAAACGLDTARFERDLEDRALHDAVRTDYAEALERGITAVPTVVLDDAWQIPGAQDLRFYRHIIDRRLATEHERQGERE